MRIGEFALDVETDLTPKPTTASSTLRGNEAHEDEDLSTLPVARVTE